MDKKGKAAFDMHLLEDVGLRRQKRDFERLRSFLVYDGHLVRRAIAGWKPSYGPNSLPFALGFLQRLGDTCRDEIPGVRRDRSVGKRSQNHADRIRRRIGPTDRSG